MKTIEISDELAEQLATELCEGGATDITALSDFVGKKLFIRTVTYHMVGKVKAVNGSLIELSQAAIVFDSGNLVTALDSGFGSNATVEKVGNMWVNSAAVTDMFPWSHAL